MDFCVALVDNALRFGFGFGQRALPLQIPVLNAQISPGWSEAERERTAGEKPKRHQCEP
jgi:hypothetical protein